MDGKPIRIISPFGPVFRLEISAFTKSPTGNTSFSKSVALANGIKDAHFVSRYSISGLVCPFSQLLIGRNV
jgi:hypothetical protein